MRSLSTVASLLACLLVAGSCDLDKERRRQGAKGARGTKASKAQPIKADPADLVRFMPNDTRTLMLLHRGRGSIVPFDRLVAPLPLPMSVAQLVGGIRGLTMGAIAMAAGKDNLGPLALIRPEEDLTLTILLQAPQGTAGRFKDAKRKLSGMPYVPTRFGWHLLGLDDKTFALVGPESARTVARLMTSDKKGQPVALTVAKLGPPKPDLVAEVRSKGPYDLTPDLSALTLGLSESEAGTLTLTLVVKPVPGKEKAVLAALQQAPKKAQGAVATALARGKPELSRGLVSVYYVIPKKRVSKIIFERPKLKLPK